MADPRKTILRLHDQLRLDALDRAQQAMNRTTIEGACAVGCSGASFMVIGMGIWCAEFAKLDARAASKLLRSLAVLYDPTSTEAARKRAERKRAQAVEALMAAVDLDMAQTEGTA